MKQHLAVLSWATAAILLLFFALAHLGVELCFLAGAGASPLVAPVTLLLALAAGDWLARREGLSGRLRLAPPAAVLGLLALALLLAAAFFDLSWDGLWYHQTAVYQMAHGWNPLKDPMHGFVNHLQDWVRHYAKGPWYFSLALFKTTGRIEWAKAEPLLALAAGFLAVFAAALDFGMRRRAAAALAAAVALNPVMICELVSFLVDGLMITFLACFVAAQIRAFRRPSPLARAVVIASAILCINTKLTGLVYFCFFAAAAGLYVLLQRRDLLWRFAGVQLAALLLGVLAFGYNPYVTNTIYRGHPLYPWMGNRPEFPGFTQDLPNRRDPVERYETPVNMQGRNRFYRFAYAIFGRPGSPLPPGNNIGNWPNNAALMWPFDVGWKDFQVFYFHELRIGGFGPLFSGAFIISLVLLLAVLIRPGGVPRLLPILLAGVIAASLLASKHTWWARYGPQLWWLPALAMAGGFAPAAGRALRGAAWGLAALMLINAAGVGVGHFRWEVEATRKTYEQLAMLRQKSSVRVYFDCFGEPYGERLRQAGVKFQTVPRFPRGTPTLELISVDPGYPGAVKAVVQ